MRLYDKNMIEMRDGRKPVISPQLKSVSNYIDVSLDDIVNFISKCELTYGKDAILPITDVEIENRCGYVFKGSTNRLEYID